MPDVHRGCFTRRVIACKAVDVAWLVSDGTVLASAEVAANSGARRRGLIGRTCLDGAMVIDPCRWIHTVGMKFAIDVAYLDETGTVVKTSSMPRNRIAAPVWSARSVIEAEAGAFERWGLHVGISVEVRP
ncbi:MAG: hypothetical protein RI958_717 [Actinomycetota bacterium]|jgi:uncharacterized membrane protein (UPF0127 family)